MHFFPAFLFNCAWHFVSFPFPGRGMRNDSSVFAVITPTIILSQFAVFDCSCPPHCCAVFLLLLSTTQFAQYFYCSCPPHYCAVFLLLLSNTLLRSISTASVLHTIAQYFYCSCPSTFLINGVLSFTFIDSFTPLTCIYFHLNRALLSLIKRCVNSLL